MSLRPPRGADTARPGGTDEIATPAVPATRIRRHRRAGGLAPRTCARLSEPSRHARRAVSARRADRHDRTPARRSHARLARPADRDRERVGRRRNHRGHARGALGRRRLHVEHRPLGLACRQRRRLHAAVRSADRPRTDRADRRGAAVAGRGEIRSGEGRARADRLAQGQSRQGAGGNDRRRRRIASRRDPVREDHRDQHPDRAVSRLRAAHAGYARGHDPPGVRPGVERAAAGRRPATCNATQ